MQQKMGRTGSTLTVRHLSFILGPESASPKAVPVVNRDKAVAKEAPGKVEHFLVLSTAALGYRQRGLRAH